MGHRAPDRRLLAFVLAGAALCAHAAEAPNWEVAHDSGCALRSAPQTVNDGYQTVQAPILVAAGKADGDAGVATHDQEVVHLRKRGMDFLNWFLFRDDHFASSPTFLRI